MQGRAGGSTRGPGNLLAVLYLNQEALARSLGLGERILVGPSGSGKTLISCIMPLFFLRPYAGVKRILLVCYNITLVNYLRRLLANKGVPLGVEGVNGHHFFDLCAEILGEPVNHAGEDSDYYQLVIQECLERLQSSSVRYEAVLVDEGQDFSPDMLSIVRGLLAPGAERFVVAMDHNQALYNLQSGQCSDHSLPVSKIQPVSYVYRNTQEISQLALDFLTATGNISASGDMRPDTSF